MNAQKEITVSGVGGQGLILCGTLLAKAAVCHDGKRATLSSEYGVETRGTFAKSDLIISGNEIYFPEATKPDVVVCLHQIAYERYSGKLPEETLLIYDSDQVTPKTENASREAGVSVLETARGLGTTAAANIVTMGVIARYTGCVTAEAAHETLKEHFCQKGEKIVALNIAAFDAGIELGAELSHR